MFIDSLPKNTQIIFQKLSETEFIGDFYLSGGSALSLQLNHRESEDLDFFNQNQFNPQLLLIELKKMGETSNVFLEKGTLNLYLNQTKLQFLYYPYKLLKSFQNYNQIKISSLVDIACTKLITISDRGSKKDFVDLYFILQKYTLSDLFVHFKNKYKDQNFNLFHIQKSLVYFDSADKEPMSLMKQEINWENVKKDLIAKVQTLS